MNHDQGDGDSVGVKSVLSNRQRAVAREGARSVALRGIGPGCVDVDVQPAIRGSASFQRLRSAADFDSRLSATIGAAVEESRRKRKAPAGGDLRTGA